MAITVVQTASGGSTPVTFSAGVTAGNTVFLVAGAYNSTGGSSISSSNPTLGGSPVTGSVAFFSPGGINGIKSALNGSNSAYICIWMMPNVPGGGTTAGISMSGQSGITGVIAYEVSGLGAAPVLDKSNSGSAANTTAVDSGASGGISVAAEFILGAAQIFNASSAGPGGWTNTHPVTNTWAGWQISTVAGTSYDWAQTGNSSGPWASGVATVAAAVSGNPGPPFYPVTQIRPKLPVPRLTGRKAAASPGAAVQNPGVVPVYGAISGAVRACLPVNLRGRVRTTPPVVTPANPPSLGPAFTPLPKPARAPIPQNGPRGRVSSSPGGPVRNPAPVTTGPVFRQAASPCRIRPALPPRGRAVSSPGAPVLNPHAGPVFVQAVQPARCRIPQNAPRGRAGGGRGAPVANIPMASPVFRLGVPGFRWNTGTPVTSG